MKASSKLLIAASLLAASTVASASIVTFTFNTETLPPMYPGDNSATSPNLLAISPGYFDDNANTYNSPAGTLGIYNTPDFNGLGVTSLGPCSGQPANTNTTEYQCVTNDEHFVDNNSNEARIQRRTWNSQNNKWGDWTNFGNRSTQRLDDFVAFQFDSDVLVTSITLGIWDYKVDENGGECKSWKRNGECDKYYDRYYIDVSFNTGDSNGSPWMNLQLDLGKSAPDSGAQLTFSPFGLYTANDWLRFGAGFGERDTGFKIKALTVETPERVDCSNAPDLPECSTTVPEPGTLSSLGLAALAMATVGRLRRRRTS